jgi:hypothetical protein
VPYWRTWVGGNGVTTDGFVADETISDLNGQLFYYGTSQGARYIGKYAIIPAGLASENYNISFIEGTLTVKEPGILAILANLTSIQRSINGTGQSQNSGTQGLQTVQTMGPGAGNNALRYYGAMDLIDQTQETNDMQEE